MLHPTCWLPSNRPFKKMVAGQPSSCNKFAVKFDIGMCSHCSLQCCLHFLEQVSPPCDKRSCVDRHAIVLLIVLIMSLMSLLTPCYARKQCQTCSNNLQRIDNLSVGFINLVITIWSGPLQQLRTIIAGRTHPIAANSQTRSHDKPWDFQAGVNVLCYPGSKYISLKKLTQTVIISYL